MCDIILTSCRVLLNGGAGGPRAANAFNSIEWVYSKAIAFSNRRCLVPLESSLPNDNSMYSELIYTYNASMIGWLLNPPSHTLCCVAPFCFCLPLGMHALTGEGTWASLEVAHDAGIRPSLGQVVYHDICESVLPIETVSSTDVTKSSSSMKTSSHATEWLSSEETSSIGNSIS